MIHRIRIQNFKSLADVSVDLAPLTVLVGKSGTGKTNFVEAVKFLRDLLSAPHGIQQAQQEWARIRPATNAKGPTCFEVEFSIRNVDGEFNYELWLDENGPQSPPRLERLTLGGNCLFHQAYEQPRPDQPRVRGIRIGPGTESQQPNPWRVEPDVIPVPPPGNIALGRIPSLSEIVIAFTALTSGIGCYAFSDQVLITAQRDRQSSGLDDNAGNYLQALKEIATNLEDLAVRKSIVASLQRVNPTVSSVELNDIQQPTHVLVGHRFDGKTLPLQLAQESAGFRRFLAHLLALYQRPPKQTLIFEHPEDGIHPGAMALLAEEFQATPESNRGQVILTTHSPQLLDHFRPEEIRVVELDGLETRIGPVLPEQMDAIKEGLLMPGELLTVDPARIQPEPAGA